MKQKALLILLAAGLIAAAVAVYSPARNMSFFFDDHVTIIKNRKIQAASFYQAVRENPFRSLVNLTFAFQAAMHRPEEPGRVLEYGAFQSFVELSGGEETRMRYYYTDPRTGESGRVLPDMKRGYIYPLPDVLPFRAVNLALHFACALLLGLVVFRLRPWRSAAFLASAAFLFHPLATESVNYISARFDLMAFLFSLAAVYFHLLADDKPSRDWFAAGFFVLALLCKESAASLPVALLLLDSARGRPRARVLFGLALSAVYVLLRLQWMIILDSPEMEKLSWPAYVLLEQRVFWIYLAKCIYPLHLNFEYNIEPKTLTDAAFAALNLALLLFALLGGATWRAAATVQLRLNLAFLLFGLLGVVFSFVLPKSGKNKAGKNKAGGEPEFWLKGPAYQVLAVPAMAWVLVSATLLVPLADVAHEHRAYPLVAVVCGALFAGVLPEIYKIHRWKKPVIVASAAIILFFALQTFSRNQDWENELHLLSDSMRKSPQKPRVIYNYADELKWYGEFDKALFWYKRHHEMEPDRQDTRVMIEMLEKRLGE